MNNGEFKNSGILEAVTRALPDPIFIIDEEGTYIEVMGGMERSLYDSPGYLKRKKLHDVFAEADADLFVSTVKKAIDSNSLVIVEYKLTSVDMKFNPMDGPSTLQWYEGRVFPFQLSNENRSCVMWIAINITEKKKAQIERDNALLELEKALSEIKVLRGILPICSNCKKIRDDEGYWNRIEQYIMEHSEAEFTHSICPDCTKKLYPELFDG